MTIKIQPPAALALVVVGGAAAWYVWRDSRPQQGLAGSTRHLAPAATRGAVLDNSLGQTTPDHLIHFGPTMRPPHWVPHKMQYPATPGQELERLTYGAPGSCTTAIPRAQRGWMFSPPSEADY